MSNTLSSANFDEKPSTNCENFNVKNGVIGLLSTIGRNRGIS